MKTVQLIVIGKLKDDHLEALEKNFLKRIKSFKFIIHELKANAENKEQEAETILKKIQEVKKSFIIALDERGKEYTSVDFSEFLFKKIENFDHLIFLIGGAEGLAQKVRDQVNSVISLSKLTLPHKFARLFFIEQLYRAITIKEGHPYHN